jgi:hypothetical protein
VTPAQFAYLDGYVRDLADRMGLKDWRIEVDRELTSDSVNARVICPDPYRRAVITLGSDFAGESAEDQRGAFVHELLHVHTWEMRTAVDTMTAPLMGQGALFAMTRDAVLAAEHPMVETLSLVLAPFMPEFTLPAE